jgi:SAM-dependent methyltransferase
MTQTNHWDKNPGHWSRIEPPLRPDDVVTRAFQDLAGGRAARVLLLGVTSELANAFDNVQAIDKNPMMLAKVWPGDTALKRAVQGNWLEMPIAQQPFDAVIGDGCLSNLDYPHAVREVLLRVHANLKPGGRFVCRLFERPDAPWSRETLLATASGPAAINFHAFKWQVAMHLAGTTQPTVPVPAILELFNELFPDRAALAARTGWPRDVIDLIDVYRESEVRFTFMNRREMLAVLPPLIADQRFDACGSYDLAECCPMLSFRRA